MIPLAIFRLAGFRDRRIEHGDDRLNIRVGPAEVRRSVLFRRNRRASQIGQRQRIARLPDCCQLTLKPCIGGPDEPRVGGQKNRHQNAQDDSGPFQGLIEAFHSTERYGVGWDKQSAVPPMVCFISDEVKFSGATAPRLSHPTPSPCVLRAFTDGFLRRLLGRRGRLGGGLPRRLSCASPACSGRRRHARPRDSGRTRR